MGAGQGFADGVQMAGSFLMPALQMRMQNNRFDKQMAQQDKQYYDRMILDQAWKEGFYGGPSMLGGESPAGPMSHGAPPSPAQSLIPYQVTRPKTDAEVMAGQFTDPTYHEEQPIPKTAWSNPNPSLAPIRTHAQPTMPSFRGPSPSSTPFSSASSSPHTEQRTLNAPKDPSMVIKRMPEVTHEAPNLRRITPGTPLPPQSMMRPQPFRQSVRRGY
jgi:hypothetical protein